MDPAPATVYYPNDLLNMEGDPSINPDLFLDVPFSRRWALHRDTIVRLYVDENRSVEDVAQIMKSTYRFDANIRQYKYHFKKWDISKSVSSAVKEQAVRILGKRTRDDTSFGGIRYKGVEIDKGKLRRYVKDDAQLDVSVKLTGSVFRQWNLPYSALKATSDHPTPGASDFSTPSDFSVFSPPVVRDHPTPTVNTLSPSNAPTPTVRAIQVKTHFDRSKSFIHGHMDEFLKGMSSSDRKIVTTWLHQFWIFTFTTVKHWGKGPKKWTAEMLRMTDFSERYSLPNSPAPFGMPTAALSQSINLGHQDGTRSTGEQSHEVPQPSSLCRWCIHVRELDYKGIDSLSPEENVTYDIQNPNDWPQWNKEPCTITERLQDALESNNFSSISAQDLPLSTSVIAEAAALSPDAMRVEAMSFAIMARNTGVVSDLAEEANGYDLDLSPIYPYHLAASYLDGSSNCCDTFDSLLGLVKQNVIKRLYVNDLGHTVLDSLMMTIMKGHTSCTPSMADDGMKAKVRFPGEDVDICGRWDADSPCVRALNANGFPRIPFPWKHMFCHTAVQAVCHTIIRLFSSYHSLDINTRSGLFNKSCFTCGDRLVPGPLHTLVLTAFHLAQRGCPGENLFGMVACLVCLLVNGADPKAEADLSIGQLLQIDEQQECTHMTMTALELSDKLPSEIRGNWSEETKLGWDCFTAVLGFAQRGRARVSVQAHESGYEGDDFFFEDIEFSMAAQSPLSHGSSRNTGEFYDVDDSKPCYHGDIDDADTEAGATTRHLHLLWSAIETELLSYRRLRDGDAWMSENFDLIVVRDGANADTGFSSLPLLRQRMMKPVCECGRLHTRRYDPIPVTDEACSFYFSNMEDWTRSTFNELFYRW
ncbi:hypothetical protein F5Y16DRAFT_370945 [Xylariaceae sp. FL0255]|nr:hypothetical protein F5Y16DRAFT_370945 [Xylariaceae sp. FL0255]